MPPSPIALLAPPWATWFSALHTAQAAAREQALDLRLARVRAFIDEHSDAAIDLEAMAAHAGLSRYHFLRAFRRAYDVTPHQYLTQRRIERAKELLMGSDLPVTEVCFEVGFHSLGSFSTLFTRHVGHAPGRYRRRMLACPELPPPVAIPACFLSFFGRSGHF
ncbi:helix-turn-helix domain-containing protein [Haliangium ochraceum]|uniref:Transcriptional regulator, AraC family n=1 Tax=Haliangium ochraceum (strain DSM 14365 / JCM 11303 / SMP-2) TaxID=502025 RepID=D0LKF1_HALO1|nr:AraC family transcriptional regulator [Haliangium ochraceum]ACY14999.1 transcriptional regulator, AraC family [Haliangium ochraceum DSM 14365]